MSTSVPQMTHFTGSAPGVREVSGIFNASFNSRLNVKDSQILVPGTANLTWDQTAVTMCALDNFAQACFVPSSCDRDHNY